MRVAVIAGAEVEQWAEIRRLYFVQKRSAV